MILYIILWLLSGLVLPTIVIIKDKEPVYAWQLPNLLLLAICGPLFPLVLLICLIININISYIRRLTKLWTNITKRIVSICEKYENVVIIPGRK